MAVRIMMKRKTYSRHRLDYVSEELLAALQLKRSYEFNDLFQVILEKLRERNAASGGEEMLRLRVYEKLQMLVAEGLVNKVGKSYRGILGLLRTRVAEMTMAKEAAAKRRETVVHTE